MSVSSSTAVRKTTSSLLTQSINHYSTIEHRYNREPIGTPSSTHLILRVYQLLPVVLRSWIERCRGYGSSFSAEASHPQITTSEHPMHLGRMMLWMHIWTTWCGYHLSIIGIETVEVARRQQVWLKVWQPRPAGVSGTSVVSRSCWNLALINDKLMEANKKLGFLTVHLETWMPSTFKKDTTTEVGSFTRFRGFYAAKDGPLVSEHRTIQHCWRLRWTRQDRIKE